MLYDKKWDKLSKEKLDNGQRSCLEAAQYIRDHGWCQGQISDASGRVCLIGAVSYAHKTNKDYHWAWNKLWLLVDGRPDYWNDQPGRTKEEVIALLERAAAS